MVMGDLVLLDQEVPARHVGSLPAVGSRSLPVHNHLNEMSPHVMYMHYEGHWRRDPDGEGAAPGLVGQLGRPWGVPPAAAAAAGPNLDAKPIEQALGRQGRDIGGGRLSRLPSPAPKRSPRWDSRCCPPWAW